MRKGAEMLNTAPRQHLFRGTKSSNLLILSYKNGGGGGS